MTNKVNNPPVFIPESDLFFDNLPLVSVFHDGKGWVAQSEGPDFYEEKPIESVAFTFDSRDKNAATEAAKFQSLGGYVQHVVRKFDEADQPYYVISDWYESSVIISFSHGK